MGHTILGDLPKSQKWSVVMRLLQSPEVDARSVSQATVRAAERRLVSLRGDPSLTYCFWLLTRLASAARSDDFAGDLSQLGISVAPSDGMLALLAQVSERTREELSRFPQSGPFSDIAATALRTSLVETVGTQNLTLFDASVEDLARPFRRHSTAAQFGELATRFFGAFYARTLRFYIDRALPGSIGGGGLATFADAEHFRSALDRHAMESARIVERFAGEWYLKHHLAADGRIGRDEAQAFTAHALRKLRTELLVDVA
jgi:hypothetical protein